MTSEGMYEIYIYEYIHIYTTLREPEREGKREAFGMSQRDPSVLEGFRDVSKSND